MSNENAQDFEERDGKCRPNILKFLTTFNLFSIAIALTSQNKILTFFRSYCAIRRLKMWRKEIDRLNRIWNRLLQVLELDHEK